MTQREVIAAGSVGLELANPSGLTALDLATARMLGDRPRDRLPRVERGVSLDEALGDVLEPELATGRCLVAFSGGRESSWLLAASTWTARKRGHPDPVPVTLRYPAAANERVVGQQERVVAHLGLDDWERVDASDALEVIGPYARRALAGAGILFPATAYVFLPLLDLARGGSLVAGGGLTDFFLFWRWARLSDVLRRRRRPRRRDVRDLASASLPRRARAALARGPVDTHTPWLRPDAAREVERLVRRRSSDVPVGFAAALRRQREHRCHTGIEASFDALGATVEARFALPLRDDRYIAALVESGGGRGFGDRRATLEHLSGHLLPVDLLRRSDGVQAREVFFGEASRTFAERWSGDGLDDGVVDVDQLRALWEGGSFPWHASMLFQVAWAHDEAFARVGYEKGTNGLDGR